MSLSPCLSDEQLESLLLGKAGADEEATLREHLLQCLRCEDRAASLQAVDRLVENVKAGMFLSEPDELPLHKLLGDASDWSLASQSTPPDTGDQTSISGGYSESPDSSLSIEISTPTPTPEVVISDPASDPTRIRQAAAAPDGAAPEQENGEPDSGAMGDAGSSGELGRVGVFRLLSVLGQGGMGVVFLAEDTALKRQVALKAMKAGERSRAAASRFLREARAAARFQHPNLVTIFAVGQDGETPYISMELLRGPDLDNRVRLHGTLTPRAAAEAIRQAARGLEHAHSKGVIHRDVKPSNLMYADDGVVKVLDLGVARLIRTDDDSRSPSEETREGMVVGTLNYMAPEQALDPSAVDERADVFSLGGVLHFLLTGKPPYQGSSRTSLILEGTSCSSNHVPADCPPKLAAVLAKMTAVQPSKRYRNMGEVIAALDRVLDAPTNVLETMPQRSVIGRLSSAAPVVGLLAAVLALTTLFVLLVAREPNRERSITPAPRPSVAASTGETSGEVTTLAPPSAGDAASTASSSEKPFSPRPAHAAMKQATWPEGSTEGVAVGAIVAPTPVAGYRSWQVVSASPDWMINGVAYDPTGQRLAIACESRLRIYERATLRVVDYTQAPAAINSIGWSPDGRRIAALLDTGSVAVWDDSLKLLALLRPAVEAWPGQSQNQIRWTNDSRSVVYSDRAAGVAHILDVAAADESRVVLQAPDDRLLGAAVSPDGKFVATGSESGKLRIWNRDGTLSHSFAVGVGAHAVDWSFDGQWIMTINAAESPSVRIWNPDGTAGPTFDHPAVMGAVWRPDSKGFLSFSSDSLVFEWSLDGKRTREASTQLGGWRAAYAPDSDDYCIAAGTRFHLGSSNTKYRDNDAYYRVGMGATDLVWSPDGARLVAGADHAAVAVWGEDGRIETFHNYMLGSPLVWRRDGGQLAFFGRWRPGIPVWDAAENNISIWADAPGVERSPLGWTRDGSLLVATPAGVTAWAGPSSQTSIPWVGASVAFGAVSPDGRRLAARCGDGLLRIYTLEGTVVASHPPAPGDAFRRVVWSPDGSQLATSQRSTVQVLSLDGALLHSFVVPESEVHSFAWTSDGRLVVGESWGFTVREQNGATALKRRRESSRVYVAGDPRGQHVASLTYGGYLQLHDLAANLLQWCGVITDRGAYTFSPAGEFLAGDPVAAEREIVCVAFREDGDAETYTPAEWRKIVEAARPER